MEFIKSFLFKNPVTPDQPQPQSVAQPAPATTIASGTYRTPSPTEEIGVVSVAELDVAYQNALAAHEVLARWASNLEALTQAIPDPALRAAAAMATTPQASPESLGQSLANAGVALTAASDSFMTKLKASHQGLLQQADTGIAAREAFVADLDARIQTRVQELAKLEGEISQARTDLQGDIRKRAALSVDLEAQAAQAQTKANSLRQQLTALKSLIPSK